MASASEQETAGNRTYQNEHMAKLFEEGMSFSGFERDGLYLAQGDGTYLNISGVSGIDSITDGRGLAFGDLDNDGDLDVIITPVQELARLVFRNNVGQDNAFVRVTLEGTDSGRDAFGTVVRLETPVGTQTKIKAGGSGFLSLSDPRLVFGLGPEAAPEDAYPLTVSWPSGLEEHYTAHAGESLLLREGRGKNVLEERRLELPRPRSTSDRILRTLALESGDPLPELQLTPVPPSERSSLLRSGGRTLVNFWATWCVPCAVEMPELERAYPQLAAAGIDLVGVSVDTHTDGVPAYLKEKGATYPNFVLSETDFPKIFAGDSLTVPLTLLLDASGNVVEAYSGWTAETRAKIETLTEDR